MNRPRGEPRDYGRLAVKRKKRCCEILSSLFTRQMAAQCGGDPKEKWGQAAASPPPRAEASNRRSRTPSLSVSQLPPHRSRDTLHLMIGARRRLIPSLERWFTPALDGAATPYIEREAGEAEVGAGAVELSPPGATSRRPSRARIRSRPRSPRIRSRTVPPRRTSLPAPPASARLSALSMILRAASTRVVLLVGVDGRAGEHRADDGSAKH